jgi:drug/metabolite transporter (DMT)-like permease
VLLGVILARGGPPREALSDLRRRPGTALLLGLVAIAAPFLLITFGELEVSSGLAAVLVAAAPLFVPVLAPALDRREGVGPSQALGLALGFVGVVLLVGVESVSSAGRLAGALAILLAALSYAVSSFMVRRAYARLPAITTSLASVGAAALLTVAPAAATAGQERPTLGAAAAVVALGVVGTAIAFIIFYRLIGEVGPGRANLVAYLVPAFALVYGPAFLDESVAPAGIGGLALILAGVALAARRPAAVRTSR